MTRFKVKLSKNSLAYKTVSKAIKEFQDETGEDNFGVFGEILTTGEFQGFILSKKDSQKIKDILNEIFSTPHEKHEKGTYENMIGIGGWNHERLLKYGYTPIKPVMSAIAGNFTYEEMIEAGWTNTTLKDQGYII